MPPVFAYRRNMALPARLSWYARARGALTYFVRAALSRIPSLRRAPGKPGVTTGRAASPVRAEEDLSALASSPTVYAALNRVAFGITVYPVRVYFGYSMGGKRPEPLDPERVPWVGSFLRLLQTPNPLDVDALFPSDPGEILFAQAVADLKAAGNAMIAVQMGASGDIVGLHRLHPQACTLVRQGGEEYWEHRATGQRPVLYPRRTVAHIRLLSWQRDARSELGVGAGTPLRPLVDAERTALEQTAAMVEQGGADVMVTARNAQGAGYLAVEENRKQVVKAMSTAMAGGVDGGRRMFVVPADLEVKDAGLKPADLKAPEMLKEARVAELMAIGVVPVAVGGDAGTYATAVLQQRVQAEWDEMLVAILEAFLLRPLARHFARRAGGRWAARADQVTARIDLSTHPGNVHGRTESIARMRSLVEMGYTPMQAADVENLDLPEPKGTPMLAPMGFGPPGAPPQRPPEGGGGAPRKPVGDGGESGAEPADAKQAEPRGWTVGRILARASETRDDPTEEERAVLWRAVEATRERSDRDLQRATERVLDEERDFYVERAIAELERAERAARIEKRAPPPAGDGGGFVSYKPIDITAILGDVEEARKRWLDGLSPDWLVTWEEGADSALNGTGIEGEIPPARPVPDDLKALEESAAQAADYSRERVRAVVQDGMDRGLPTSEIAENLRADSAFDRPRALRIARTETVRAQSSGTNARYAKAEEQGVEMEQEWITARDGAVRDSHRALDRQRVAIGGSWTLPGGRETPGPGLSGDPSEDINCRCGRRPRVKG